MSILRKIRSAFGYLVHGEFIDFFNALTSFLRLQPSLMIGDVRLLTVAPFESRNEPEPFVSDPTLQIFGDAGPEIIDQLLDCMEGTTDYAWIEPKDRRRRFEKMFRHGSRLWIAREGETVAGFIWETGDVYVVHYGTTEIELELRTDEAFVEFLFVRESCRRRGIHTALFAAIHRASPSVRYSALITADNAPSIRSHLKYGFHPSGRILFFHLFGLIVASFRFEKTRRRLFRLKPNVPFKISRGD